MRRRRRFPFYVVHSSPEEVLILYPRLHARYSRTTLGAWLLPRAASAYFTSGAWARIAAAESLDGTSSRLPAGEYPPTKFVWILTPRYRVVRGLVSNLFRELRGVDSSGL